VLDELRDLVGVADRIDITQEQQGEMGDFLAGDLPDAVILVRNGHDDEVTHVDLLFVTSCPDEIRSVG
jgi:hypothetical protein